jgi:hypothetical protein
MLITITILNTIQRSVFYLKQCFRDWILSPKRCVLNKDSTMDNVQDCDSHKHVDLICLNTQDMRVDNGCGFTDHKSPVTILHIAMFSVYVFLAARKRLKLFSFFRFSLISYSFSYFPSFLLFVAK